MALPSCFPHKFGDLALTVRVRYVTVAEDITVPVILVGGRVLRKTTEATNQGSGCLRLDLTV